MKSKLLFSVVVLLASLNLYAQSSKKTVQKLMDKSGATAQLAQIDGMIDAQLATKKASFDSDEDFQKFIQIMKSGFNGENATQFYMEYFTENANEDSLKKMIKLYNEPLLVEVNKLELMANDPTKQQEQATFFQNLQSNPPSENRVQQLILLNNELGTAEMTIKIVKNMIGALAKGVNSSLPADKQISIEEINQKIESGLPPTFDQQMTQQVIVMSMYTYKDLEDAKLDEYIKVWQSPLGKYYTQLGVKAFDYSFSKMGEVTGSNFKEIVK